MLDSGREKSVAASTIIEETARDVRVGGGSGLLNIRWGAGNKVEENIKAGIQKLAENAGALVNDGTS